MGRKHSIKGLFAAMLAVALVIEAAGCGNNSGQSESRQDTIGQADSTVDSASEPAAEKVESGRDLFFIETVEKYPAEYRGTTNQAKTEQNEDARPKLLSHVDNMDAYDTIILIYPNWLAYHNLIQCTQA